MVGTYSHTDTELTSTINDTFYNCTSLKRPVQVLRIGQICITISL